jgi:hypothetical protein
MRCSPRLNNGVSLKHLCIGQKTSGVDDDFIDNTDFNLLHQEKTTPTKVNWNNKTLSLRCSPRLNSGKSTKHLSDGPTMSEVAGLQVSPSLLFDTYEDLYCHMSTYAQQNGFKINKSNHHCKQETKDGKAKILERFPVGSLDLKTNFVQRGVIKCSSESGCKFEVRFTHVKDEKDNVYKYIIKQEGFNLEHSGHLLTVANTESRRVSYEMIHREKQLTDKELHFLCDLAIFTGDNVGKIRTNMQRRFPGHNYDSNLLKRVVNKYRDEFYGKGRDQINKLIRLGIEERERGGAFDLYSDDTYRFTWQCFFKKWHT